MEDLVADSRDAGEEEERDDVRIDERVEQAREEAGPDVVDLRAVEVQHVSLRLRLEAVQLLEKRGQRRRDRVDHVLTQGGRGVDARCLANGARGELRVAPVAL